ncbi:MAG TPA: 16S rRNA (guanine(527)-N(7))-methyltransferase RsmG [Micromonosporaceae bacterium]|nr:16S rRNA (guanine(527)-N(7))-methyltransferase RsmG [Micromonosporaceae bacterium]
MFGDRLPLAHAYAHLLAPEGVVRGLIGPREAPRIWDRHLLNCAAVAELLPAGARVVDVGSGAGLPGLVLALSRPDISMILIEPLARRAAFLVEAVDRLTLGGSVTVLRARAEEAANQPDGPPLVEVVTARAVAPLDRLVAWCLPLAEVGGRMLALKGSSAAEEVGQHERAVERAGGSAPVIRHCGVGLIDPPTTVVEVVRQRGNPVAGRGWAASPGRSPARSARSRSADGRRSRRNDRRSR